VEVVSYNFFCTFCWNWSKKAQPDWISPLAAATEGVAFRPGQRAQPRAMPHWAESRPTERDATWCLLVIKLVLKRIHSTYTYQHVLGGNFARVYVWGSSPRWILIGHRNFWEIVFWFIYNVAATCTCITQRLLLLLLHFRLWLLYMASCCCYYWACESNHFD